MRNVKVGFFNGHALQEVSIFVDKQAAIDSLKENGYTVHKVEKDTGKVIMLRGEQQWAIIKGQ